MKPRGIVYIGVEKYKRMSLPVKASVWFMLCSFIQKGLSFLTTPIFTRIMPQDEYGLISLYTSWSGIVMIFATLNLSSGSYGKAMMKYEKNRDVYTSSVMGLASTCTAVVFLFYILTKGLWNKLSGISTELMILMFIDLLISLSISFYSTRERFEYHYKKVVAITLAQSILGTLLSIYLVINADGNQAFLKILGTIVVHALFSVPILIRIIGKGKCIYKKQYWNYAFKFNVALIPHYLSQKILTQVDWIMIGNICGSSYTALYSVAYQLANALNLITCAIDSAFSPWVMMNIRDKRHKKIAGIITVIVIVLGLVCFFFTLFAPELIWVLGGDGYMEAIWVIPPVTMSTVFNMMYSLIAHYAFYFEKKKFIITGSCLAASLNIILNAIFIPLFGFVAAGYTTLACYIAYAFTHYCFMRRICKENGIANPFNGKLLWVLSMFFALLGVVGSALYFNTLVRFLVIALMLAFFVIGCIYLEKRENMSVLGTIKSRLKI